MMFLPIAERELRIRARRPGTFALRCIAATLALGLAGVLLTLAGLSPGKVGAMVFDTLTVLAFLFCLYDGLRNTADCLSEEKRAGTLGFLFLTDLKGYDVVAGKLLATSLSSFYGILGILPALGLPLLTGGVTVGEFWRAVLVLMVTLFFSLSTGIFVSSASRSEQRAWSASLGIILFVTVVPPLLNWLPFVRFELLNWASPTVAFSNISQAGYNVVPGKFWTAVIGVHALSWIFMAAASVILPRAWQERPAIRAKRLLLPMDAAKRLQLLETNPMLWLVSRDDRIKVFLWGLVAVFAAVFVVLWIISGFAGPLLGAFAAFVFLIHFFIAGRVAFYVCHSFVSARDSGLLELLLSTPLSTKEILDGFRAAFKRTFGGPVVLLLWIEGTIVGSYFFLNDEAALGALMLLIVGALAAAFVMELYAVATFGMWVSLTAKKPSQAFNKTILMVVVVPMMIGLFCCAPVYPIVAILKNLIFFSYHTPLYRDFRKIITERGSSTILGPK